ncbi:MAG: hypothetical protein JXR68_11745 [Bacteroidales bacterium]|nr:hypothetical protein [Bacteroidales bacterium]
MKKIILIFVFSILFVPSIFSQCREFTNNEVVPKLGDFLLTGKYHSMKLAEGEEILIFKTINRGLTYRFVVMSENQIPQPHFMIIDWDNNVLYDNQTDNNSNVHDLICDKTQRIKIIIKIPRSSSSPGVNEGCVGLVMGIKTN